MSTFQNWTLPLPIVLAPGSSETLSAILAQSFGAAAAQFSGAWITYQPASQLSSWDFSYWNLSSESVGAWYVNGADIGGGFNDQTHVTSSSFGSATFKAGDDIGAFAYILVGDIQYSMITVAPNLMSPTAGAGPPTPADIVAAAYRFNNYYGFIANDNDCHNIASAVAASAGATLTENTGSLDPTQNEQGGFWRIVYRGSQPNPVANWQTLVQPGDIVRMGWKTGGEHTTTVLAVNPNGSLVVYDNADYVGGVEGIGVHTVNYDTQTIASDITIYRLTTDGLYLESPDAAGETVNGNIFNDDEVGMGNDNLSGGPGNDVFSETTGVNTIDGGGGVNRVVVPFTYAQTTTAHHANGSWTLSDPGLSDSVTNIQLVQFTDRTIALPQALAPPRMDFNGDGASDILFLNPNGALAMWEMNGAGVTGGGIFQTLGAGWTVAGTGDFNGDGKADILLSTAGGALALWDMNGTHVVGGGAAGQLGAGWTLGPTGDFNGDGMSDLLFQNASGALGMWEMNNTRIVGGGIFAALGANSGWSLAGTGDFNGDGKSDILLQNVNSQIAIWEMNGASVIGGGVIGALGAGSGWSVAGVGDFNGDGDADILFDNVNGALAMWEMNGTSITGGGIFQSLGANSGWSVAGVGDYNGDGYADILLHNTSGANQMWEMNGTTVIGGGAPPAIGSPWIIQHS